MLVKITIPFLLGLSFSPTIDDHELNHPPPSPTLSAHTEPMPIS